MALPDPKLQTLMSLSDAALYGTGMMRVEHVPQGAEMSLSDFQKFIEEARRNGENPSQLRKWAQDYAAMQMHPRMQVSPGTGAIGSGKTDMPALKPRVWNNEPAMTYDAVRDRLTPVGAIFMRLNASPQPGQSLQLPHIAHISAHIVQPRNPQNFEYQPPSKVFVFIVDDEGTDITLEDEHPHLFPSDNLILRIKMITDK